MNAFSMMPDCSFEELIPIFSARYSRDHIWLRPAMKRYGIWRLVHQFTDHRFTTHDPAHDTVSSQSSHYNHLSNPSLMYSETTIEGLETQPLSPELFPQSCAHLLDAASRVLIRHVVCCGNTYWTAFSEKFCVERIRDQHSKHHKSYIIWSRITCRLQ